MYSNSNHITNKCEQTYTIKKNHIHEYEYQFNLNLNYYNLKFNW